MTTSEWKTTIQNKINTTLLSLGKTVWDFLIGDVPDTITMVMGYLMTEVYAHIEDMVNQAFYSSARGRWIRQHALDRSISISSGSYATGEVTFSRTDTSGTLTIIAGSSVSTSQSVINGVSFTTDEELIIPDGSDSGSVSITASAVGILYNVEAGTIRYITSPISGVSVINDSATTGGTDRDTDTSLRIKIAEWTEHIGKATHGAIIYRAKSVQEGIEVQVAENPSGEERYDSSSDRFSYSSGWSTVSNSLYFWGQAMHTTTDTAEVTFTVKYADYVVPVFGCPTASTICQIYLDGVLQYVFNTYSSGTTVELETPIYLRNYNSHVIKIVKLSGSDLIIDSMRVVSNSERNSTFDIYVDDGSGSASWTLMNSVKTAVNAYRPLGVEYFIKRTETSTLDFTFNILFTTSANKDTAKSNISADIAEYLTTIKPGAMIYINNLYQFITSQTINGIAQVEYATIVSPSENIQLNAQSIARLGSITYNEL